jgi:beta-aspartyl-peptidase (threonine type)
MSRFALAIAGMVLVSCRFSPDSAEIITVLGEQAKAWNEGDLDAFMATYLRSSELSFAGASGITRGWEATRARFAERYPDRAAMGRLKFVPIEILPLGADSAYLLGRFALEREPPHEDVDGVFTLVLLKTPEGWKIVHDHTSVVGG